MMVLAGFAGILLSIPFLPPIDGGARFYASTMAFFFLFVAFPLKDLRLQNRPSAESQSVGLIRTVEILSLGGMVLTILLPILNQQFNNVQQVDIPHCPSDQLPFVAQVAPGTYIDLDPRQDSACGLVPNVCLSDFAANGVDATTDDFYQELVAQASAVDAVTRVTVYNNFFDEKVHYLLGTSQQLQPVNRDQLVVGCASEIETEHQSIYKVELVLKP
jgi:hypothetical protein